MNNILAIAPGTPRTTDDPEFMNFLTQQHPTSRSLLVHITGSEVASGGGGGASEEAPGADVPAVSTVVAGENPSGDVENIAVDANGKVLVTTNYEKAPGAALPTVVAAAGFRDGSGNVAVPLVDASGRVNVLLSSSSATVTVTSTPDKATGTAVPASASVIGINNGGNVIIPTGDASGRMNVVGQADKATASAVPAVVSVIGVNNGSGNVVIPSADAAGRINVNIPTASADLTTLVPTQITKTISATGTPEAIAADATYFRHASIIAKKAARTLNVGTIYIGGSSTNDAQAFDLEPGDVWTIDAPNGTKLDLNDFYVDVLNAGDGVIVIYW